MLNRAVLIVRPKQPFLDWAAQLDDSGLVRNVEGEQTAYLVPEFEMTMTHNAFLGLFTPRYSSGSSTRGIRMNPRGLGTEVLSSFVSGLRLNCTRSWKTLVISNLSTMKPNSAVERTSRRRCCGSVVLSWRRAPAHLDR